MYAHIWFATRGRQQILSGEAKETGYDALKECAEEKGFLILDSAFNKDHAHLLVDIDRQCMIPALVRMVKCNVARKINILLKRKGPLWARRYKWKYIAKQNLKVVNEYIQNQK